MSEYRTSLVSLLNSLSGEAHIVEVGVHRGKTSEHLLARLPKITMTLVDPWTPYAEAMADQQTQFKAETMNRVAPYRTRCRILAMPSVKAASEAQPADLVFIDADHSYEACLADCRAWWPVVKPGGIFCGHDFGKGLGVDQAVLEWAAESGVRVDVHPGNVWVVLKEFA